MDSDYLSWLIAEIDRLLGNIGLLHADIAPGVVSPGLDAAVRQRLPAGIDATVAHLRDLRADLETWRQHLEAARQPRQPPPGIANPNRDKRNRLGE